MTRPTWRLCHVEDLAVVVALVAFGVAAACFLALLATAPWEWWR